MSSTISGGILNGSYQFGRSSKSPFRSFDAKRGSPDKTKLVSQTFKKFQERLAMKDHIKP
jgi:hypothetical protein